MKKVISTDKAPGAVGPYVQATQAGDFVFVSGQLGLDPATGKMAEGGVEAQAKQSLKNLKAILAEAGLTTANVLKTTVFLADIADFAAVNAIYGEAFGDSFPARSAIQVGALPLGGLVEIEAIACK